MKKLLPLICLLVTLQTGNLLAQYKVQPRALFQNAERSSEPINILIRGDVQSLRAYVASHGGKVKYSYGEISSVTIPGSSLRDLASKPFVKFIESGMAAGKPMNDLMLENNNVLPIHAGLSPFLQAYTGKDVVVGIIDSGIDFNHGDFKDSLGNTRIKFIWDHTKPYDATLTPEPYGYGQAWDSAAIDGGTCTHDDQAGYYGHGSTVAGAAIGNGLATGNFKGVAPEADIIAVSTNFSSANWLNDIADAMHYIFAKADALGKPCVINASLGDYYGSHDGRDNAALLIDSMLEAKSGRIIVCSAGNSGDLVYHLGYNPGTDTLFTWFEQNSSINWLPPEYDITGNGAIFLDAFANTSDLANLKMAISSDLNTPTYSRRGITDFYSISDILNGIYPLDGYGFFNDTLVNGSGDILAQVHIYAGIINDGSGFQIEVIVDPDSLSGYNYGVVSTGNCRFDVWSKASLLGTSDITYTGLPTEAAFPLIANYRSPDSDQTIVNSWACSPKVITVGNYTNRDSYVDYNGTTQTFSTPRGAIALKSSFGPSRVNDLKPDVAASGDIMMSPGRLATIASHKISNPEKVSEDGMHSRNGGTSMASPVVAGIAALFLEKCPLSTFQDFKDALLNTAEADSFTGTLPNNRWGMGKPDANALLSTTNFSPVLSADNGTSICEGTSTELSTVLPYNAFSWNTGDTSSTLMVDSAGSFIVTVTNSKGCKGRSAPAIISVNPLPAVPLITRSGNKLTSGPSSNYQWKKDGANMGGENNQQLNITSPGVYSVVVSDSAGCSNESGPFNVSVVCSNPGKPTFVSRSVMQIRIGVTAPASVDQFSIRYTEDGTANYKWKITPGGYTQTTLNDLKPGTLYVIDVKGICGSTYSSFSDTLKISTLNSSCSPVPKPLASSIGTIIAKISFTGDTVDEYSIRYKITGTSENKWVKLPGNVFQGWLKDLVPNTTYSAEVLAICGGLPSGFSDTIQFTTLNTTCPTPTKPLASPESTTAIVSWTAGSVPDKFILRFAPVGSSQWAWKYCTGASNSIQISGLLPLTSYHIRIKSECSGVSSGFSDSTHFLTGAGKSEVTGLFENTNDNHFRIYPNPSSGNTNIYYETEIPMEFILQITDLTGKLIFSERNITGPGGIFIPVNTGNISSGVYLIAIKSGESEIHSRLVVE